MTEDLVQWLGEQLDEDERIARAATPGPWEQDSKRVGFLSSEEYWDVADCSGTPTARENAEHVARHDPAQVLREIDAKRRLVRSYEAVVAEFNCSGPAMVAYDRLTGSVSALRHAVELLALPYANRPGYREEWRP